MNRAITQGIQMCACVLLLMPTACSQDVLEPPVSELAEPEGRTYPVQMGNGQVQPQSSAEALELQVRGAIADLAVRTGTAKDAISVSQARPVHWGSSALGCPKDGMMYTQALVPGVLLILEAGGVFYRYHGRLTSKLVYCPAQRAKDPAIGSGQEMM